MPDALPTSGKLRLIYFGSGAFGLPTLARLTEAHDIALIVTQPDRPAGRRRVLTPTPIGSFAAERGLPTIKPPSPNESAVIEQIHAMPADAYVVIAYGHKLGPALLGERFAINLHASLLPKFRGAAPINWAMINNEPETGVSVITLAQTMDAGAILAQSSTPIDPLETAGELHDRLAQLGVEPVEQTLRAWQSGTLEPVKQDDRAASRAPKLAKADGTVSFDQPARAVRARIHGLTPWPGCAVRLGEQSVKLLRVQDVDDAPEGVTPGTILDDGRIVCGGGAVRILEIQPPGGRDMSWEDYSRGHRLPAEARCEAL